MRTKKLSLPNVEKVTNVQQQRIPLVDLNQDGRSSNNETVLSMNNAQSRREVDQTMCNFMSKYWSKKMLITCTFLVILFLVGTVVINVDSQSRKSRAAPSQVDYATAKSTILPRFVTSFKLAKATRIYGYPDDLALRKLQNLFYEKLRIGSVNNLPVKSIVIAEFNQLLDQFDFVAMPSTSKIYFDVAFGVLKSDASTEQKSAQEIFKDPEITQNKIKQIIFPAAGIDVNQGKVDVFVDSSSNKKILLPVTTPQDKRLINTLQKIRDLTTRNAVQQTIFPADSKDNESLLKAILHLAAISDEALGNRNVDDEGDSNEVGKLEHQFGHLYLKFVLAQKLAQQSDFYKEKDQLQEKFQTVLFDSMKKKFPAESFTEEDVKRVYERALRGFKFELPPTLETLFKNAQISIPRTCPSEINNYFSTSFPSLDDTRMEKLLKYAGINEGKVDLFFELKAVIVHKEEDTNAPDYLKRSRCDQDLAALDGELEGFLKNNAFERPFNARLFVLKGDRTQDDQIRFLLHLLAITDRVLNPIRIDEEPLNKTACQRSFSTTTENDESTLKNCCKNKC